MGKKCKFAIFHFVFVVVALVDFIPTYFSKRFCGFFYVLAMQNMGQAKNERRWQAISNNPLHSRLFVSPHFLRDRNIQNIVCSPMEMLAMQATFKSNMIILLGVVTTADQNKSFGSLEISRRKLSNLLFHTEVLSNKSFRTRLMSFCK